MRFLFCLLVLIGLTFTVSAQGDTIVNSADHEPKLEALKSLRITEVIDFRPDTSSIGYTWNGFKLVKLNVKGGAARLFAAYISSVQPQIDKYATPIVLVIKKLEANEEIGLPDVATLHIELEFYRQDAHEYNLAFRFSRNYEKRALDATHHHKTNITQAMRDAFTEFTDALKNGTAVTAIIPTESNGHYAIMDTNLPVRGIYRSFEEFRDNTPGIKHNIEVQERGHGARTWFGTVEKQPYYLDEKGRRVKIKDPIWGFSDGKKAYICYDHEYFEITRTGNIFTFNPYSEVSKSTFGTLSGLTGGAPESVVYILDLETGDTSEVK